MGELMSNSDVKLKGISESIISEDYIIDSDDIEFIMTNITKFSIGALRSIMSTDYNISLVRRMLLDKYIIQDIVYRDGDIYWEFKNDMFDSHAIIRKFFLINNL